MRNYELTYIVKPDLDPASQTALIERVTGVVTADGGTVVKTTQWGLRHLAYPIRRYREGLYVFSIIELEATALARVEQRLRLIEDILRYLLVRADDEGGAADVMGGDEAAEPAPAETPAEAPSEAAAPSEPVAESAATTA
jgi:small subunit ribosomal protein S6